MQGAAAEQERRRILAFWQMVELFSPQTIPKAERHAAGPIERQVIKWVPGEPLPWERLPEPTPSEKGPRVWQHTVYLGVYDLENTYQILHKIFADDPDAYDERKPGRSACAGLLIDQEGALVVDSAVLSSALWAVGRIHSPGVADPRWAYGFELAQAAFAEQSSRFDSRRRDQMGGDAPPPHDTASLLTLLSIAHNAAGIAGLPMLATQNIIIASRAVAQQQASSDIDFINSFYLDDLRTVTDSARHGVALTQYLTGDAALRTDARIDVLAHPEAVDAGTRIERLPKGRWPSDPSYGLALSQQFAVNQAINDLAPSAGLIGVNGPPGTGKTTMLRDILAGNVVERARRLAALKRPSDAFTGRRHSWTTARGPKRQLPELIPRLTGFEMVVASATNAAADNVSSEIPAKNAIGAHWRNRADYFGDIASAVLRRSAKDGDRAVTAWGLVAAPLGHKSNRNTFNSAFWFDVSNTGDGMKTMRTLLKEWAAGTRGFTPWRQARERFCQAERRVDRLIAQRHAAETRMREIPRLKQREDHLRRELARLQEQIQRTEADIAQHHDTERQASSEAESARTRHARQLAAKPGALETLFTLGRAVRQWRNQLDEASDALQAAELNETEARRTGQQLRLQLAAAHDAVTTSRADLAAMRAEETRLSAACQEDRQRYGKSYPGPEWTGDQRELHAPWLDAELDEARSDLFLAALRLHQDFLANTARVMLTGLRAAVDVVSGNHPHGLETEKLWAAWQLFFLVVPLVSTTFASFGRMFRDIGPESIGWLLIDEAGQAAPQVAAGAIWRSRRAVIVGDPLQLEPLATIPRKMLHDIASTYGVSETWIPPEASVQTLADRVSRYGTVLSQGDRDMWVSAPLVVHRRCDDPMFTLCNRLAYNGIMINGVPPRTSGPGASNPFDDTPSGPRVAWSHWADEPSPTPGSHLQAKEIARLENALAYLRDKGVPASDVIAISPFRAVASALRTLASRYPGLRAGTIHTAQGREAPVVILVLGGDPAKPGAKAWAASRVNLVNVAASRARRRLYVIGDRDSWAQHNYFRQLADALTPAARQRTEPPS